MSLRVLLAWLLLAVLLLGSSTCSSSRPIGGADADGVGSAAAGGMHGNGENAAAPRRSLGSRAKSPPSPLPNNTKSTAMPAPPPPKI
ncbi:hypothetical protein ABZP36_012570 [Zizania latifolia]